MKRLFYSCCIFMLSLSCKTTQAPATWSPGGPAMDCYPNHGMFPCAFTVDQFHEQTPVSLHIKSVFFKGKENAVNFTWNGKIKFETDLLKVNDSLAVKLVIGKTSDNRQNKFLYKLMVYEWKKDCWKAMSIFDTFYSVCANPVQLNGYAIGSPGDSYYFRIKEGAISF